MSYDKSFIDAIATGRASHKQWDALDGRCAFRAALIDVPFESRNDPIREESADALLEELRFGWWDTHHQDGGTYQQPFED